MPTPSPIFKPLSDDGNDVFYAGADEATGEVEEIGLEVEEIGVDVEDDVVLAGGETGTEERPETPYRTAHAARSSPSWTQLVWRMLYI